MALEDLNCGPYRHSHWERKVLLSFEKIFSVTCYKGSIFLSPNLKGEQRDIWFCQLPSPTQVRGVRKQISLSCWQLLVFAFALQKLIEQPCLLHLLCLNQETLCSRQNFLSNLRQPFIAAYPRTGHRSWELTTIYDLLIHPRGRLFWLAPDNDFIGSDTSWKWDASNSTSKCDLCAASCSKKKSIREPSLNSWPL